MGWLYWHSDGTLFYNFKNTWLGYFNDLEPILPSLWSNYLKDLKYVYYRWKIVAWVDVINFKPYTGYNKFSYSNFWIDNEGVYLRWEYITGFNSKNFTVEDAENIINTKTINVKRRKATGEDYIIIWDDIYFRATASADAWTFEFIKEYPEEGYEFWRDKDYLYFNGIKLKYYTGNIYGDIDFKSALHYVRKIKNDTEIYLDSKVYSDSLIKKNNTKSPSQYLIIQGRVNHVRLVDADTETFRPFATYPDKGYEYWVDKDYVYTYGRKLKDYRSDTFSEDDIDIFWEYRRWFSSDLLDKRADEAKKDQIDLVGQKELEVKQKEKIDKPLDIGVFEDEQISKLDIYNSHYLFFSIGGISFLFLLLYLIRKFL